MTDSLEVVAVRIERIGAVVRLVVLRPQTRSAVVLAAGGERRLVEGIDGRSIGALDRDVRRARRRAPSRDPHVRLIGMAVADRLAEVGDLHVAERRQGTLVEALGSLEVADADSDVVDHGSTLLRSWTDGPWIRRPSPVYREPWHGQSQLRSAAFHST